MTRFSRNHAPFSVLTGCDGIAAWDKRRMGMDKKLIAFMVIAAVLGVGLGVYRSPARKQGAAQDLFPPEKLQGYVTDTHIKVVDDGKGGRPVVATAVTPYGIKPAQVSPTGYGALLALHRQFPKSDWISVFIAEDSAMAEASNWVGVAELRIGKVVITGGVPTQAQIDSLNKSGILVRRPSPADLKLTATVFDSTGSLTAARWDLSQTLMGAGSGRIDKSHFLSLSLETSPLHAAAKALGKDPKEVQSTLLSVTRYYWLNAGELL